MKIFYFLTALGLTISLVSCMCEGKSSLAVHDQKVYLVSNGEEAALAELARSDDMPLAMMPTYSFSSDSSKIVFVGYGEDEFEIFHFALGMKIPDPVGGEGTIDGRTSIRWSQDGALVLFNRGERIWLYDTKGDSCWKLSDPEEEWMEDYDPSFSVDGTRIFFFRGSRFEYVFSGDKCSIKLDGTDLREEEEEIPTYPPEDLRGDE